MVNSGKSSKVKGNNSFPPLTNDIADILNEAYHKYHNRSFINHDPIQVPHSFSKKENIEITAFLTSSIAWGNRNMIIKNGFKLTKLLGNDPLDFIMNATKNDIDKLDGFVHRTINISDLHFFLHSLQNIYKNKGGLEAVFTKPYRKSRSIFDGINGFRKVFMQVKHDASSERHISNPEKNSAAKRLNLFLMWMVRNDKYGIHFGLWKNISQSDLLIPLDVHVSNTAQALGILNRKSKDWKSAIQLTRYLKQLDHKDPVKYDFALFGLSNDKQL